ncbi:MAG TPA: ABC transporter permease [Vicinamibacterales bacterium]|nr:ABC transporter permease [Vicinamibacterales bacterium]
MDRFLSDLRYAWRRLLRAPGFSAIAVATLALGIGANTAIFSLVKTVVLQPLPYRSPDRLVMIWGCMEKGATTDLSGPEMRDYMAESRTFAGAAAYTGGSANLTGGGGEPERVVTALVTPNLFDTLGVAPLLGRAFSASHDPRDIADRVVISHSLWRRRLGGNPDVIGSRMLVNGAPMTIAAVMPDGFRLPLDFSDDRPSELWRPLDLRDLDSWGDHSLTGFGRLRDDVTVERATATLRALEDRWIRDRVGGGWNDRDVKRRAAVPIRDLVVGDVRPALWMLLAAVGVILIIACANVANLMLAKSDERQREVAVRLAIGASRARIAGQLMTESVLLSAVGGAAGLGLAYAALRVIIGLRPAGVPRIDHIVIDGGVLAFTLLLSVATGVLFGLAPAIEWSRRDVHAPLKEGASSVSTGRSGRLFRDGLVVMQMALSVVLMIGALLLARSFVKLRRVDLGFDARHALTFRLVLPVASYPSDADAIRVVRTLQRRFSELPGVRVVGATRLLPLTGTIGNWSITIEGREKAPGENPNGDWQVVTPGYFESMAMTVMRGRGFSETDDERAPIVAVINETMASRYWPGADAIGERFRVAGPTSPWITVVGIVGGVRHNAVVETPRAEMYVPHAQWGAAGASTRRAMTFVIRTEGEPLDALSHVREAVRSIDPTLPLSDVRALDGVAADALAQPRFTTMLLGVFAALALTLAAIGIYGIIALLVSRRRREIGIRMALGARAAEIVGMVVGRGMLLVAIGVAAGLAGAAGLTRLMAGLLYAVAPLDPATFVTVPLVLSTIALCACAIPAARAARLDPVSALRQE